MATISNNMSGQDCKEVGSAYKRRNDNNTSHWVVSTSHLLNTSGEGATLGGPVLWSADSKHCFIDNKSNYLNFK